MKNGPGTCCEVALPEKTKTTVEGKESFIQIRVIIVVLATLGSVCLFACRVCINVAIVVMVRNPSKNETLPDILSNSTGVHIEHLPSNSKAGIFDWSQSMQGVILGSYFYGYAATQLVAGVLTQKLDPVKFCGYGMLAASLLTVSIPITAEIHVSLVIISMITMGVLHGPSLSCFFIICRNWFPTAEISTAMSMVTVGFAIGQAASMYITAYLCKHGFAGGWPSAFFTIGTVSVGWCACWIMYVTTLPSKHPHVSQVELKKIQDGRVNKAKKSGVKWSMVLTSGAFWASAAAKAAYGFANGVIASKLPSYIETVLKLELHHNGLINALLYICVCCANLFGGFASDFLKERTRLKLTVVRKIFQSAAMAIPAALLVTIPFCTNKVIIVVLFIAAASTLGLFTGGDQPIVADMAPDYVGTIFGFLNTFAASQGILAPLLTGIILDSGLGTVAAWDIVLFGTAGLLIVGMCIFDVFATAKQQPWGAD